MLSIEELEATHRIPEKGIMSDVGFARRFSRKSCRRRAAAPQHGKGEAPADALHRAP